MASTSKAKATANSEESPAHQIVVTRRPILQEGGGDAQTEASEDGQAEKKLSPHKELSVQPLGAPLLPNDALPSKAKTDDKPSETVAEAVEAEVPPKLADEQPVSDETPEEAATEPEATDDASEEEAPTNDKQTAEQLEAVDEAAEAKRAVEVQTLVDSKTYFLPINSVERRRTKHFVIAGVLISIILAVAWVDVALDAGLVRIGDVQPLTHFFSS
jgi:hypothetical protein